jgi:hypothetical protein
MHAHPEVSSHGLPGGAEVLMIFLTGSSLRREGPQHALRAAIPNPLINMEKGQQEGFYPEIRGDLFLFVRKRNFH